MSAGSETSVKHSPGTWAVHDAGTELSVVVVAGSYRLHIATIADERTGRTPADDANARLIAAAPELLAACKFVHSTGGLVGANLTNALAAVRVAIAKATQP